LSDLKPKFEKFAVDAWRAPKRVIAAVGVARSAYEYVLAWAKTYTGGGELPILHHQAVGYLLARLR
jgi:alkylation response protein AidB-like acyl-CoA dehydrogenase